MSGLYPGDVRSLNDVEKLASEKEWAVLAAMVLRAKDLAALGALASAADGWRAFAWLWPVFNPGDPRHCQVISERLSGRVEVPENLRDAVARFVLEPTPQLTAGSFDTYQQQANNAVLLRRAAQEKLLASLDPRARYAGDLAREVLDAEEGRLWMELRHAAFDILGASRKKADRSALFERAEERGPHGRLRPLLGLSPPLLKGEEARVRVALDEALPVRGPFVADGPGEEDHWGYARQLAAQLPVISLAWLLGGAWAEHEVDRERLFGSDFARLLGQEKLRALLASQLPEATRRHLLRAAAANLSLEDKAELGRWTHANLPPEWSAPLRDQLSAEARPNRRFMRSDAGRAALEALRDFALACDDPQAAAAFASNLQPGEVPALMESVPSPGPLPARVGRVAGWLLRYDGEGPMRDKAEEDAFREDVSNLVGLYPDDADRASFLAGLLEGEPEVDDPESGATDTRGASDDGEPQEKVDLLDLQFLGMEVLGRPECMRVFARAGNAFDLVPAAYEADDPPEAFLRIAEAAIEHLGGGALETVLSKCGWAKLGLDRYGRFIAALRRRPYALVREATSALDSLPKPDADAVPAGHLRMVLEAALDTAPVDLAKLNAERVDDHLRGLLDQRGVDLRRLALRWALVLEPEEDTVKLLTTKRESTRGLDEEFAEVLRAYARHLADRARDSTLDSEERARALKLARTADQEEAREGAFVVVDTARAGDLRLAAASVLADTEAHPDDEKRLERLLADEGDADTSRWLAAALRNISSGTVARALENLRSLVGVSTEPGADPRVFLPSEVWDARFVECVDGARRTRAGDPKAYVGALVVLAELLADVAAAERHLANPDRSPLGRKGFEEAAAMRANQATKPDHGELIRRQSLTIAFPWYHQVAVLREMRAAHPALVGSTEPVLIGAEDSDYAQRLFRDVVEGWEASMRETQRLRT